MNAATEYREANGTRKISVFRAGGSAIGVEIAYGASRSPREKHRSNERAPLQNDSYIMSFINGLSEIYSNAAVKFIAHKAPENQMATFHVEPA